MRKFFSSLCAIFLLTVTSSCHLYWTYFGEGEWVQKIDGPEITHAIQHYVAYLRHVKLLRLEDSSVYYDSSINAVRMEFISMKVMELCEARELMVDIVEGLLVELNNNPILAPQFANFPLTSANLEINVRFESFEMDFVDPYYVGWMSLRDDIVKIYAANIREEGNNIWDYRVEPYFKSREFVLYGRESEELFKSVFDMEYENCLEKEQYCPEIKVKPRYYSPYTDEHSYDRPFPRKGPTHSH